MVHHARRMQKMVHHSDDKRVDDQPRDACIYMYVALRFKSLYINIYVFIDPEIPSHMQQRNLEIVHRNLKSNI